MFLLVRSNTEIYAARNSIVGSERQKLEGSSKGQNWLGRAVRGMVGARYFNYF
jgi:hypothetical protein